LTETAAETETETETAPETPRPSRRRTGFAWALAIITLLGLGVRVGYVAGFKWDGSLAGDELFYNGEANSLSRGGGFVDPFVALDPSQPRREAADHPPLTVVVLAPVSWLGHRLSPGGNNNANAHRLTMALVGTATVAALGLLGRRVAGDGAGLLAAGLAALHPNLWMNDGHVMSESLAVLAVVGALLATYRCLREPSWQNVVLLGAVCGIAALARAELLLLAPALALPALLVGHLRSGDRWRKVALAATATLVVIGPWVVFNMARFDRPTFLSTTDGQTLLGANCDPAYGGIGLGLWHLECLRYISGDQSQVNAFQRDEAVRYARDELHRAPVVVAARVGRVWGVYAPSYMIDYGEGEGRERWATAAAVWLLYPMAALAVVGGLSLRRRLDLLWPLLVPVALVTLVAATTYGHIRFRSLAEPSLVVLAVIGILWLAERVGVRGAGQTAWVRSQP
jgi:4-amino-4-deoxy-L-arabinose transferase-like glycosyltransferase